MSKKGDDERAGSPLERRDARSGSTNRRRFLATAGSAALVGVAGCSGGGTNGESGGTDQVAFGTLPIAAVAEVFVADEMGYFEDRNIELDIQRIQDFGTAVPSLASGDLDVATGSITGGIANAINGGQPIQVIADQTQYWSNQPAANRFWVRDELYSEGMSVTDLPDSFTYAVNSQGGSLDYLLGRLLQRVGLDLDDVTIQQMPFRQMVQSMAEGDIDVCSIPDPIGLQMRSEAGAGQLIYGSQLAPEMQIGVYLAGSQFTEDRSDVARRWLEAYLLGLRDYYEMGGYQDEEVAGIISDAIDVPAGAIRSSVPSLPHKNGRVNADSLMNMQEYYVCRGFADETVAASELITEQPLEAALEEVGELDSAEAEPSVETITEWRGNAPNPWPPVGEMIPPEDFPDPSLCE